MINTRNDPDFNQMLKDRETSFASSLTITTRLIVLMVILLLGMFFFLT